MNRWMDADGRIRQYPRRPRDRAALLALIGERAFDVDEQMTEAEVNARLQQFTDDVSTLRRYLVVQEELARTRDGSAYWRTQRAE